MSKAFEKSTRTANVTSLLFMATLISSFSLIIVYRKDWLGRPANFKGRVIVIRPMLKVHVT